LAPADVCAWYLRVWLISDFEVL